MKKSAFTLIELLVVISIIAILAGIALPVFGKVLERGKATSDGSNLRQLGIGLAAYLNDNDDQMFSVAAAGGATLPWPQTMHTKYVTNWKVYKSPFDKRPDPSTEPMPISYAINVNCYDKNTSTYISPSQLLVIAPHVQVGKAEVTFVDEKSDTNTVLPMPQSANKEGTHNNRTQINALFADTHVETLNYQKYGKTDTDEGKKLWYPKGQPDL